MRVEEKTSTNYIRAQEEMVLWWEAEKETVPCLKSPLLSSNFKQELEYRSRRNPLLLRGVVEALENFQETERESNLEVTIWSRIYKNYHWKLIEDQIFKFMMDAKLRGGVWEEG